MAVNKKANNVNTTIIQYNKSILFNNCDTFCVPKCGKVDQLYAKVQYPTASLKYGISQSFFVEISPAFSGKLFSKYAPRVSVIATRNI